MDQTKFCKTMLWGLIGKERRNYISENGSVWKRKCILPQAGPHFRTLTLVKSLVEHTFMRAVETLL